MDRCDPIIPNTILDYWRIIARHRWIIIGLIVVAVLAAGILSKMSPKLYEAKVTLFPAKETPTAGGGISFGDKERGGGSSSMILEAMGGSKSGPSVMEILHAIMVSRRMGEAIVNELNLLEYYGAPTPAVAINFLRRETDIRPSPYKTFEITMLTRNPQMAADIANAYASNLDRLNKEMTITATKRNRMFIEARLAEKAKRLEEAENVLKAFQIEHHIVSAPKQEGAAKGTVGPMEAAIDLHSEIVSLEVELAALKEYALPSHPMVNQLKAQIQELTKQLDKLEQDEANRSLARRRTRPPLSQKVFPAVEEVPALFLEHLRLSRQVKIEETVYGMLVGMLEQAKIAEVRDLPTVQVIDVAVPSTVHSRPNTLQNVQVAAALSAVLGILLAFFLNYLQMLKAREKELGAKEIGADDLLSDSNGNGKAEVHAVAPKEIERLHG